MVIFLEHYFTNNQNLKSELRHITYEYNNYKFIFSSDNGVFSKNKVDYGSRLLVETLLKNVIKVNLNILDIGCGYGYLGITIAKILKSSLTMADVNKRALHLAKMNSHDNKVDAQIIESNIYDQITQTFDIIVSNPPIRAGKEVVYQMLLGAFDHLKEHGELWFVMRKDQGVKSTIKVLNEKYETTIMAKDKGFYIVKAQKIYR